MQEFLSQKTATRNEPQYFVHFNSFINPLVGIAKKAIHWQREEASKQTVMYKNAYFH